MCTLRVTKVDINMVIYRNITKPTYMYMYAQVCAALVIIATRTHVQGVQCSCNDRDWQ